MRPLRALARRAARGVRRTFPHLLRNRKHDVLAPLPSAELDGPLPVELVDIASRAIVGASRADVTAVASRFPRQEDRGYILLWPGEHYRLLYALGEIIRPRLAVEVGTYRGAGALILAEVSEKVVTYDITPMQEISGCPQEAILQRANVEQRIGNLAEPDFLRTQLDTLASADLIFVDGPKDGVFEQAFVPRLLEVATPGALVVLDDIRFRCMQPLWRSLGVPRIDMGEFGHVSGTGVLMVRR